MLFVVGAAYGGGLLAPCRGKYSRLGKRGRLISVGRKTRRLAKPGVPGGARYLWPSTDYYMHTLSLWGTALMLVCLLAAAGGFVTVRAQSRLRASLVAATPGPAPGVGSARATAVSTLVGQPPGPEWTDGQGVAATFQRPQDVAVDAQGNVYVADLTAIRKITSAGLVSTLAGEAPGLQAMHKGHLVRVKYSNYEPVDGPRGVARFGLIEGITVSLGGTVYVSVKNTIKRISPQGEVTTLAGQAYVKGDTNGKGYTDGKGHADGPGAHASFDHPTGLAVDTHGNVFVADTYNETIRKITPAGVVSTLAGVAGVAGYADGPGAAARFDRPRALTFAPDGALYVFEQINRTIRRISPQGEVTTWGGHPSNVKPGAGPGAHLKLDYHHGLAIDHTGSLYLIKDNNGIRRFRLRDGVELPYAGTPDGRGHVDAATPAEARFNFPAAVAAGPDGSLYVADEQNKVVRKISPQGVVSTLAGFNDDPRFNIETARQGLSNPGGVAFDRQGNVYVVDGGNQVIRRVSPAGEMRIWAGQHGQRGFADGPAAQAEFNNPVDIAAGPDGAFYVTDTGSNTIRKISAEGVVSTIAGLPSQAGERDGPAGKAQFNKPTTIAVAPDGTVYVTDSKTSAVRRLSPRGRVSTFVKGWNQGWVSPFSNAARMVPFPSAVATGPDGAVYVYQGALYRYSPAGQRRLLAGDPAAQSGFADGAGAQVRFNRPLALAVDAQGNVYVADTGNHLIRRVSPTGEVTTIAGDQRYEKKHRARLRSRHSKYI